jgi:hypothetical protein
MNQIVLDLSLSQKILSAVTNFFQYKETNVDYVLKSVRKPEFPPSKRARIISLLGYSEF